MVSVLLRNESFELFSRFSAKSAKQFRKSTSSIRNCPAPQASSPPVASLPSQWLQQHAGGVCQEPRIILHLYYALIPPPASPPSPSHPSPQAHTSTEWRPRAQKAAPQPKGRGPSGVKERRSARRKRGKAPMKPKGGHQPQARGRRSGNA